MRIRHLVDLKVVTDEFDSVFQAVPERWIPAAIDKLVIVHEQPLSAADAVIATDIVSPPVLASEGPLHAMFELR